jgi:hypothetical protein
VAEKATVYVTLYALSKGIFALRDATRQVGVTGRVYYHQSPYFIELSRGCELTAERAGEVAKEMAAKKIASLKKQIRKLEPLTSSPKWQDR